MNDEPKCLWCHGKLHRGEPVNYIDNARPRLGGCHARQCSDAYIASGAETSKDAFAARQVLN